MTTTAATASFCAPQPRPKKRQRRKRKRNSRVASRCFGVSRAKRCDSCQLVPAATRRQRPSPTYDGRREKSYAPQPPPPFRRSAKHRTHLLCGPRLLPIHRPTGLGRTRPPLHGWSAISRATCHAMTCCCCCVVVRWALITTPLIWLFTVSMISIFGGQC